MMEYGSQPPLAFYAGFVEFWHVIGDHPGCPGIMRGFDSVVGGVDHESGMTGIRLDGQAS